jgi:8-oxo-dGTP diphosphatase
MPHTRYVAGFAFSADGEKVVLIEKKRPKWQAGKLNGVGGHIEAGEYPITAIVREYKEETGVKSKASDWYCFACLRGKEFVLYFYSAFNDALLNVQTMTDESVCVYDRRRVQELPIQFPTIPNLTWLLPLAIDAHREDYNLITDAVYL